MQHKDCHKILKPRCKYLQQLEVHVVMFYTCRCCYFSVHFHSAAAPPSSSIEDHTRGVPRSQWVENYIQGKMNQPLPTYEAAQIRSKFQRTIRYELLQLLLGISARVRGKLNRVQLEWLLLF